jgi:hypothetical protein
MLVVKEGLINSVRPEPVEGFFCKIKERSMDQPFPAVTAQRERTIDQSLLKEGQTDGSALPITFIAVNSLHLVDNERTRWKKVVPAKPH